MSSLALIAIDGPSGVGKSTTAKAVAKALGWDYLDTGAMYRAVALALLRQDVPLEDREGLERVLSSLGFEQRGNRFFMGPEDVSEAIRGPEVTRFVTPVSADARVRTVMVEQQRRMGGRGRWVVDGRDIGTVVFPSACCKVFLTASPEARGRRRHLEVAAKGDASSLKEIIADLQRRDSADSTREVAPLKMAEGAFLLDSSELDLEQVVQQILARHGIHS
jgi:cytidylate kinase